MSVLINNIDNAFRDIVDGIKVHQIWIQLAWRELHTQYNRTLLGILWVPLSPVIHIAIIGSVFFIVLNETLDYISYFASSWVVWVLWKNTIADSTSLWMRSAKFITNMKIPLSVFLFNAILKSMISALMIFPLPFAAILILGRSVNYQNFFWIFPGVFLFYANMLWGLVLISIACVRFRDIGKLIPHILFILHFITPILWPVQRLGKYQYIAELNPLFHLIEIVRSPLTGQEPQSISLMLALAMAVMGNICAFLLFSWARKRLVLWV